jgi:hypothetical protein
MRKQQQKNWTDNIAFQQDCLSQYKMSVYKKPEKLSLRAQRVFQLQQELPAVAGWHQIQEVY